MAGTSRLHVSWGPAEVIEIEVTPEARTKQDHAALRYARLGSYHALHVIHQ